MAAPVGKLLLDLGVLPDESALADALARQSDRLPLASVCYVLGYADERSLAEALTISVGRPAVVLDECVIDAELIDGISPDLLRRLQMLPIYVEAGTIYVAAARPDEVAGHAQALFARRGEVAVCVALAVTLARAIRGVIAARGRGDARWVGPEAAVDGPARHPRLALVTADDTLNEDALGERAEQAVLEDVTKEIKVDDLFLDTAEVSVGGDVPPRATSVGGDTPWQTTGVAAVPSRRRAPAPVDDDVAELSRHLERGPVLAPGGLPRLLIVDDDFATRHLLVKEIEPRGYEVATAASGTDAIAVLRDMAPDIVIADILLPGIDGFRLCRAIKGTARLEGVGVILMSAVIDSGRVTADVLQRYGADGYAAKPLDTARLLRIVRELLGRRRAVVRSGDETFTQAIERYQAGDVDGAIGLLRDGIAHDPAASKVRFALANLLQKSLRLEEAIDEYESVVELEPRYFPALTRLAYLYYKKGHVARAVDIWRRALPHCDDPALRKNIEVFVRKLAHESLAHRM